MGADRLPPRVHGRAARHHLSSAGGAAARPSAARSHRGGDALGDDHGREMRVGPGQVGPSDAGVDDPQPLVAPHPAVRIDDPAHGTRTTRRGRSRRGANGCPTRRVGGGHRPYRRARSAGCSSRCINRSTPTPSTLVDLVASISKSTWGFDRQIVRRPNLARRMDVHERDHHHPVRGASGPRWSMGSTCRSVAASPERTADHRDGSERTSGPRSIAEWDRGWPDGPGVATPPPRSTPERSSIAGEWIAPALTTTSPASISSPSASRTPRARRPSTSTRSTGHAASVVRFGRARADAR